MVKFDSLEEQEARAREQLHTSSKGSKIDLGRLVNP